MSKFQALNYIQQNIVVELIVFILESTGSDNIVLMVSAKCFFNSASRYDNMSIALWQHKQPTLFYTQGTLFRLPAPAE